MKSTFMIINTKLNLQLFSRVSQVRSGIALGGEALEVDLSSDWSDSGNHGCSQDGPMWRRQMITTETLKRELDYLDTCQHLSEG